MDYGEVVEVYKKIESTTKKLEMTQHLADFFKKVPKEVIDKVVYLTQGKLYPDYVGIELGVAEKLAMRAIAQAAGADLRRVEEVFKRTGDIGLTAEEVLLRGRAITLFTFIEATKAEKLSVERVYETFDKIAKASGEGAQELKIKLLAALLKDSMPEEARYIARMATGELRLGVAEMTILDALALAYCGSKDYRPLVERAFNLSSDLGAVAKTVAYEGVEGVGGFKITIGKPVRPMLAERLPSAEEILKKMEGRCVAEYKYDGERLQAHKRGDGVTLFSRRLENITHHYPDACELIKDYVKAKEAIIECECVAIDPETGEMRAFQELMHRRRKYGVQEAMKTYPVSLYMFDALYVDGEDLTLKPYPARREVLKEIMEEADRVKLAEYKLIEDPKGLEEFFEEAVSSGCEGVICKALNEASVYQAGARGWLWVKYKRDYRSEMMDTVDLVAVGAFWGRGKRAGTYGALLMAAYDQEADIFRTVCKVGTGFSDEDLAKLPEIYKPYVIPHKHPRVDSKMEPDVHLNPSSPPLEILGAEITLSPLHTCAMNAVKEGAGLAIRFPRFTGRWRDDKSPEQATTVAEIIEMYRARLKKVEEKPSSTL